MANSPSTGAQIAASPGMPKTNTIEKAKRALRKGKSPSTAAGEFIREEMERMGDAKQDGRSRKRAIAVGLAKARRAGIPLRPQPETQAQKRSREAVERAYQAGQKKKQASSAKRTATRKRAQTSGAAPAKRRAKRKSS
jgi:hypothetical protein